MSRVLVWTMAAGMAALGQDAREIVKEVQRRTTTKSQRYEGTLEVIGKGDRVAAKRWVFQRLGSFGDSKSVLRFTDPAEVKGVALLIHNHPDRASDQWMWRPAIGRDQRIALQDRSTRFFGTDFSFEDLEERDAEQFDMKVVGQENGLWKIESFPKKKSQYTRALVWVRQSNYTFVKVENYDAKGLVRVVDYKDFAQVQGVWTARTTEVHDVRRESRTVLKYDKLEYNLPIAESEFTLQALRRDL